MDIERQTWISYPICNELIHGNYYSLQKKEIIIIDEIKGKKS